MSERPERFGIYEVNQLVGTGGFADVYLCDHAGLDTHVAVKVLHPHLARDPEICDRFLQEAQVLWRADSDRVIQVTHVDQLADGRPYFVMRYADRGSLQSFIEAQASEVGALFTLQQVVGLGVELVDCLRVLMSRELVHRDLKPGNVLIKTIRTPDSQRSERFDLPANERMVLADFGLAKRLEQGTNMPSQLGGTPVYMAPELAALTAEVSWRADQFAVGVIIYEIATGAVPWPMRGLAQVSDLQLQADSVCEWRPDFPDQLDDVVSRALAPEAADRYDSPADFGDALMSLLSDEAPDPDAAASRLILRDLCTTARRDTPTVAGEALALAELALDEPVRIGIIGGSRLSPVPLGLKLVGERPPPGELSLFGSVVVRLTHGSPSLSATLSGGGGDVDGSWRKDDSGFLHLDLPVTPWMVETITLQVPNADFEDVEIIDIPHAVLRRNRTLVEEIYSTFDVLVVGVPAERDAEMAAIDEVLGLGGRSGGPFAAVGVRQLGVSTGSQHPALLSTVAGDDTIDLRVMLDEILAPQRRDDCRSGSAWDALCGAVSEDSRSVGARLATRLEDIAAEHPALRELTLLRSDLRGSELDSATRRRVHRLLGRRMSSARLGVLPDAPVESLLASVADERKAWERDDRVPDALTDVMMASLSRLELKLKNRSEGARR
jgi:serine/threonine protein kinase